MQTSSKKRLNEIKNKAEAIEIQRILIEALDIDDLKKANQAIASLQNVAGESLAKLPSLQNGLTEARQQLITASSDISNTKGGFSGFIKGIRDKANAAIANSIANVFALVTAMVYGFKHLPDVIPSFEFTLVIDNKTQKMNFSTITNFLRKQYKDDADEYEERVANVSLDTMSGINLPFKIEFNEKQAYNTLINIFRPKGVMTLIHRMVNLRGSGIPFVNEDDLVKELMQLSMKELYDISSRAKGLDTPVEQSDIKQAVQLSNQKSETKPASNVAPEEVKQPEPEPGVAATKKPKTMNQQIKNMLTKLDKSEKIALAKALASDLKKE